MHTINAYPNPKTAWTKSTGVVCPAVGEAAMSVLGFGPALVRRCAS